MNQKTQEEETYLVLDSRCLILGLFVEYDESMIRHTGTAKACCRACNNKFYAEGRIVIKRSGEVMWGWFFDGVWIVLKDTNEKE